jgi:alkylation response protein AidB-like acyl-CoA dehydrogenase
MPTLRMPDAASMSVTTSAAAGPETGAGPRPPVQLPRCADRLHHDLLFDDETAEIRREARTFADRDVAPRAYEIATREESVESFPRDVFDAMAAVDLFRIPFATIDGGRGLRRPVCGAATVIEELAYHSSSVAAIFDVHCILAGRALERGSDALRRRWLRPLVSGEIIAAFATTEPASSSDLSPQSVQATAVRNPGGFQLTGRKRFITNAPVSDLIVVLATCDGRPCLFAVDAHVEGVRVGAPDLKMGNRGQLTSDVVLENVRVAAGDLIGEEGAGLHIALAALTYGRVGIAASGVGMAQSAFDRAVAHLSTRRAFGRRIAEFQHWQFRMVDHATRLENARNLYAKAARRMDAGVEFPEPEASMAKAYATELAVELARDAIQAMGGYGFLREVAEDGTSFRVEEIYRDAKIGEIYEGTNEIQRMITARAIFGREIVG